ncbi:unnamed protein product [Schistosoma mattheei]|uniref:Uncharacterized protein n=1 Tax=Schistosoma mattheei TaxID=31246 RepID=A0A183PLJ6_9TREM|nr:unnamed protein product [Schistosoma mattheei]
MQLDFADDLALLTHTQQQMQNMTRAAAASTAVSLNIHKGKGKILRYNIACNNPVTIDGEDLEDVKTFTYLGSIIDEHSRSDADVKARIGARATYLQLKNIWNSKQVSVHQHQGQDFQYKCQDSSTEWSENLENYERHPSSRRYGCLLTVFYVKYNRSVGQTQSAATNVGENKPDSSRGRIQEEAL